jgi:oligopeptide/dipeptide ABC transporter ATP-binding protein
MRSIHVWRIPVAKTTIPHITEIALANTIISPVLEVKNLRTYFKSEDGLVRAVDGVDFHVMAGEVIGLVGESGCGKSVTSLSIMRLIASPGYVESGEILFEGRDLLKISEKEMGDIRGDRISMIFQQPQTSLNPVFMAGDQIAEVLQTHKFLEKSEAWKSAVELLRLVGIPDPERRARSYPHELSGGQAQRVMIAIALALMPQLLIADEPTTALDVTIQAQILDLLRGLQDKFKTAVILITHDLGVIAEMAERVAVMYAGKIVEQAYVNPLFREPLHPYTQGLIGSIPILGKVKERLEVIPGIVPNLINLPSGCRFAPRCRLREEHGLKICTVTEPDLIEISPNHLVRCWLYQSLRDHQAPLENKMTGWSKNK